MNRKYYKVKNANLFNTILSNLFQYAINIAWATVIANIALFFARTFDDALDNYIVNNIIKCIMAVIALGLWALILMPFMPKRVVVDDYFVTIKRNWFNLDILPNVWKWQICYSEINSCEVFNEHYSKSRWILSGNRYIYCFPSWENIVVISTSDGKNYYIPIENRETFVDEINTRIELSKARK